MDLLTNLIGGSIVYGTMALLYTAMVVVPLALIVGALRLRTAVQHNNHPHITIHRNHRHGYQTH